LIWPYVIDQISERRLLGWGFCAFWSLVNPIAYQISKAVAADGGSWEVFAIPNAHNGLLEMLLQIGFLGTSFFLFLWGRNFVLAIKCLNGPAKQIGLSSVLLLVGIIIEGVTETVLLAAQQPWTNLFFLMGLICEKNLRSARAARRQKTAIMHAGRQHIRSFDRFGLRR
jgi:O-antigen ligase